jgi:hypothetical protein
MTKQRFNKIKEEAERRLNLWLENSTFDEMSVNGSFVRFNMSLALLGYPFHKEPWMKGFNKFVTEDEYYSKEYDTIVSALFMKALTKVKIESI